METGEQWHGEEVVTAIQGRRLPYNLNVTVYTQLVQYHDAVQFLGYTNGGPNTGLD